MKDKSVVDSGRDKSQVALVGRAVDNCVTVGRHVGDEETFKEDRAHRDGATRVFGI